MRDAVAKLRRDGETVRLGDMLDTKVYVMTSKLAPLLAVLIVIFGSYYSEATSTDLALWDGSYRSSFDFHMSSISVCPALLPIEIEIQVESGLLSGFIFNNGGGNKHDFCKLYHNGTISGKVSEDGTLKGVKIKQSNGHSREHSSYKLKGNLNGEIAIYSRSSEYHPKHKFHLVKD